MNNTPIRRRPVMIYHAAQNVRADNPGMEVAIAFGLDGVMETVAIIDNLGGDMVEVSPADARAMAHAILAQVDGARLAS